MWAEPKLGYDDSNIYPHSIRPSFSFFTPPSFSFLLLLIPSCHFLLFLIQLPSSKYLERNSSQDSTTAAAAGNANPANDFNESQLKRKKRLARAKERRTTLVLGIVMITFTGD